MNLFKFIFYKISLRNKMSLDEIFMSQYKTPPPPANLKTQGFRCRECGAKTKVKDTRSYRGCTFRVRQCLVCDHKMITEERVR